MTYVITETCIGEEDKSCLDVCPVDCIHEAPEMLVIDPDECIDCGACEPECPVHAICPLDALPSGMERFPAINEAWRQGPEGAARILAAHPLPRREGAG